MRPKDAPLDVNNSSGLLRLVEEVHATGKPRELQRDGEVVAVLVPFPGSDAPSMKRRALSAQNLADVRAAAGSWSDIDVEQFLADVYTARDVPDDRFPVDL